MDGDTSLRMFFRAGRLLWGDFRIRCRWVGLLSIGLCSFLYYIKIYGVVKQIRYKLIIPDPNSASDFHCPIP